MVEEANKLWLFFQKFIDEQAMDHVKIINSPDRVMREKLESMEWYARYVEYVTPDAIIKGVTDFRDKYRIPNTPERTELREAEHNVEVIETILEIIQNLKKKIKTNEINIETYDQHNAMLLMILDPILIND